MMYKDVVKQSRAHALACRMIFHHHHQWRAHMTSYAHIRDLKGCNILPPCHMVCVYVFVGVEKNMCTIKRTTVRGEKCWGVQKRGSFVGHAWIRHWCVVNIVWPYDTHTKGSSDLFTFRHPSLPLCMVKDIESYSFFLNHSVVIISWRSTSTRCVIIRVTVVAVMARAIAARQGAKTILRSIHKHRVCCAYHDIFSFQRFDSDTILPGSPESIREKRQPIVAQWVIVTDFGPYPSGQTTNTHHHHNEDTVFSL